MHEPVTKFNAKNPRQRLGVGEVRYRSQSYGVPRSAYLFDYLRGLGAVK
jgi:hypothetical protein